MEPVVAERDYVSIGRQYAEDVIAGKIRACTWIKAACQRQLDDLARQDWPYRFDCQAAARVCKFIELLPHVQGKWDTPTIVLQPWQCFIWTSIFGWVHKETGLRRFRKALVVVPRKNAKSTCAAATALYLLALDDEPGSQVFSAATTRDQAKVVWDIAKKMAENSPAFRQKFGVRALSHSITVETNAAFFKPLSRDADSLEGLNPHGAIIDELHAHAVREVFDVLDEGTGSRRQPLVFMISTEGDNATGVFAEQVDYGQQILDGRHQDETFFCVIYTIDKDVDWTTTEAWYMANPNLGVSVFEDDIAIRCRQAQKNPASQSSFLTKRLNVRVGAGTAYFNMLAWKNLCVDGELKIEDFRGKPCTVALDLASKIDLAAKIYLFRLEAERVRAKYAVFATFYIPEDSLERGNPNYDFYRGWAEQDRLLLTPGNVIDFDFIERDLLADQKNFQLIEVGFDPFQANQLSTRMLAEGLPMVEIPQTVRQMSEPMKELGALVQQGQIRHDGDPVLSWMVGNTTARVDAKENVYPTKPRAESKIDGAVALIMALSRAMVVTKPRESVYETRGIRFL